MEIPQVKKISPKQARAYAAMTVASLLAGAACGGAETAEPPATSAAVANTTPSTILPPGTTQPTTTAPPSTPTTVPAPPTTSPLSEEDQAKQAVIEAAKNAWHLFNEAKLDPTNDVKVRAAFAAYTGSARTRVEGIIAEYRSSHWRSLTSQSAPAHVDVYTDSVDIDLASNSATVELCNLGSNVMVESGGNPDGSDRMLDDSITAYWTRESYVLTDGGWMKADAEVIQTFAESLVCEPSA